MNAQPINMDAVESLLAFWAEAGIDACLDDAPTDRTRIVMPPALKAVSRATADVLAPIDTQDQVAEARRMAAAANTLDEVAAAVAAFEGCELAGMARCTIFGRGAQDADLLVIGEAPDEEDEAQARAFSGPAGRLLDRVVAAAGLTDRVYLTQSVFWRPPGGRSPTPQEQAVCAPFVERAAALLKPRAALLLGAATARSVLSTDEPILRLRGQWRDWRLPEGGIVTPTLATLHPGFLLKQPLAKRQVWSDILSVMARLDAERGSGESA